MAKEQARLYEGMFIIKASLSEEARNKAFAKIQSVIEGFGGEIRNIIEMGKRRLTYMIGDQREGYYFVVYFETLPSTNKPTLQELRLHEDLIRFCVFQTEEVMEKLEFKPLVQQQ